MMAVSGAHIPFRDILSSELAHREIRHWGLLAVGSLAIAGLFALLLAFSRLPGIHTVFPWPLGFFGKGLVIHVIFSFVVWFLAVFALLTSLATHHQTQGRTLRLAGAGRAGVILTALSFPLLFLPAFMSGSEASLNNYVPVIIHPLYYMGLLVLGAGILLPVLRLFANLTGQDGERSPFVTAMMLGGVIYLAALVAFALAYWPLRGEPFSEAFNEELFWGGGHLFQFLNVLLMLTAWHFLARNSLGPETADPDILRLSAMLLAAFALLGLTFYLPVRLFAETETLAFTRLQYALGPPALFLGVVILADMMRLRREAGRLPWDNAAFLALALSLLVFGVGGFLGFFVDGADTRTPAHYHGVIAAVTLSFMGLFLTLILPAMGRAVALGRAVKGLILAFGLGQTLAALGLFWAGGHGTARKVAGAAQGLEPGAKIGMFLNGIGALIAVIGGVMFIVMVLKALWPARPADR